MKRLKIIGLSLLALFALSAFAASMASAEEGVLPTQTGKTFTLKALGAVSFATLRATEPPIACATLTGEGKFLAAGGLPDQHATGTLDFNGCKTSGFPFNTLGDKAELLLLKVLFLICLVEPTKKIYGILVEPKETVHLEIPALGALILVKGAVIAENLSGNALKALYIFDLEGSKGDQKRALKCTINGKEFKHTLEAAADTTTDEMASETVEKGIDVTFAQEVELMDT